MDRPLVIPEDLKEQYEDCLADDSRTGRTTTSGFMSNLIESIARLEAENAALRAQVERLSEALENLIDPFTHNPLCECKNCKAKAVLIAARKGKL